MPMCPDCKCSHSRVLLHTPHVRGTCISSDLTNLREPCRVGGGPIRLTFRYHMLEKRITKTTRRGRIMRRRMKATTMPAMMAVDNVSSPGETAVWGETEMTHATDLNRDQYIVLSTVLKWV